ncbi:hypothetical protein [Rhizobium sp. BE258]|jgi:hypothetical protein|uniref:hypothetical protein n=1 Tax=unclassified Rhizobium TaxID=2613769 RepID=UPI002865A2F4|nr:hypothetical protein [Rhizobium sp. BE258]MDR7142633.1 hypothetical protein [Rhizobium sp. BE258]
MIIRHAFRKSIHPRHGSPGRGARPGLRGTDAILLMLAGLLVAAAVLRLFHG